MELSARRYDRSARTGVRRRSTCTARARTRPCPPCSTTRPVALRHPDPLGRPADLGGGGAGFRAALDARGFVEVHTPKIVASATESGANVFAVDYFGRPAYLAQSPQFYKQIMVGVFERVYEVGAGVPGRTARHRAPLSPSTPRSTSSSGFIADHRDVMAVLRDVLAGMVRRGGATQRARSTLGLTLPEVPAQIPVALHRRAGDGRAAPARTCAASPTSPRPTSGAGGVGCANTGQRLRLRRGYPMVQAAVLHPPRPGAGPATRTASTCCSGVSNWSPAGSGCTATRTTSRRSPRRARPLEPYRSYLDAFRHGMPPHGGFARAPPLARRVGRHTNR